MKIWGRGPAGAKALRQDGNARQEGRREEEGAQVRSHGESLRLPVCLPPIGAYNKEGTVVPRPPRSRGDQVHLDSVEVPAFRRCWEAWCVWDEVSQPGAS